MGFRDLREFLRILDKMGELELIEGADWNLEIGTITEVAATRTARNPALLFDNIRGYPSG